MEAVPGNVGHLVSQYKTSPAAELKMKRIHFTSEDYGSIFAVFV